MKKIPKYTTFNGADPIRKKKLKTDHTVMFVSTRQLKSKDKRPHTQNEEAKRIIVCSCIGAAIGLGNTKERSNNNSESKVKQTESTKNGIRIGVSQY